MLLDMITNAANAIEAYNTQLKINASNIANMNVNGYKRLGLSFQTIFEKLLRQGTPAYSSENLGGINPLQFGTGMAVSQVGVDFSQGDLTGGANLDLAIVGSGLFVVSPDGGRNFLYTRTGKFNVDNKGNLVTDTGMQVYGFRKAGSIASGGALVPITVSSNFDSTKYAVSFDDTGTLALFELTGTSTTGTNTLGNKVRDLGYQIGLTTFANLSGLEQKSGNVFAETLASGAPLMPTVPESGSVGMISPRQLEKSNVNYISETLDSMEAQRAMNGNLTMVKLASDMITNFINKLG